MVVLFIDVTKCSEVQMNQLRNDKVMENYIVTGQLGGNRVMAQKNKMMGQRIADQNQEIEERECFKLYTLFNLVQVTYTCGFMWLRKRICFSERRNSGSDSDMDALSDVDDYSMTICFVH